MLVFVDNVLVTSSLSLTKPQFVIHDQKPRQMTKAEITATGRFLKPRPGTPHLHKVIAVKPDGTVRTIINRPA